MKYKEIEKYKENFFTVSKNKNFYLYLFVIFLLYIKYNIKNDDNDANFFFKFSAKNIFIKLMDNGFYFIYI